MSNLNRIDALEQQVDMGVTGEQVPVHISHDEVVYLNILQDGQSVDQETGLREYSKLSIVLKNPRVRELFMTLIGVLESGEPIPEDLKAILDTPSQEEEEGFEPIESDYDPHVQEMAQTGEGEDKILVMMPTDVVKLFDSIQGGEHTDPTLGLQEFFSFKNVFRSVARVVTTVAGGIGGFIMGGPMGAAAGAAAGNMIGRGVTGQKFGGDMLRAGAMNGLYGFGAGSLAASGLLGSGVAGMGAGASTAGTGAAGAGLGATGAGTGAAGAGLGAGTAGAAPIVNGIASTAPGMTQAATPYIAGAAAKTAAAAPGLFSGLGSYALPAGLIGGSLLLSQSGKKKEEEANRRELEKNQPLYDEYNRKALGKYDSPYSVKMSEDEFDPMYYRRREYSEPKRRSHYKTGGKVTGIAITGKGTGQSDEIKHTAKENDWIWDATTVAHAGDGSSNAGQKALKNFEKFLLKEELPKVHDVIKQTLREKPLRKVPCALSDQERRTHAPIVAAAGKGSFQKGGVVLRKMTKELRKHKASNGLGLPPAAHDLTVYYKKALRGE
jgi:hypothetical protein